MDFSIASLRNPSKYIPRRNNTPIRIILHAPIRHFKIRTFSAPPPYLRPTNSIPPSLHVRISLAKPEHEAAQVLSWWGEGVTLSGTYP